MEKGKTGPKPKAPTEGTILGLPVGRDKTIVPQDQVEELAALGCNNKEIANFFGVKEDAISRNFAAELVKGREVMKIKLRRAMFKNACQNMNAAVQIFLAKNVLGMVSEPAQGEGSAPLPWNEADATVEIGEEHDEEN
mgnify:FL=1|tara:strand:- start:1022 stop:1435 length:414 start_codon:yes stop_codon:yes gene_type:complete